jgi:hypothetical protein
MHYAYAFSPDGAACHEAHSPYPELVPLEAFQANYPSCLVAVFDAPQSPGVPPEHLRAEISEGQVVAVLVDPDYAPPVPTPDPVQARLEALEAAVKANLLGSDHDKRWLRIKEFAKDKGIPWIKANPTATEQDVVDALMAEAQADVELSQDEAVTLAGEHLARWLLATYAVEAKRRGYIPAANFEALRDLVVNATDKQLKQMLAVL